MPKITVATYALHTGLPVRDIALTFRDTITRPAGTLERIAAKSSRIRWEFFTPEADDGPFAEFDTNDDEPTYVVVARFSTQPRAPEGTWMELLQQGGGDIFLRIWDCHSHRNVLVSHADGRGPRGCVRNFLDILVEADPRIEVTEAKERMRV